jgi:hypothetical protein
MALGLSLAAECNHPDAKWLVKLFAATGPPRNEDEAKEIFLAQGSDPRALSFAGLVGCIIDKQCLLIAASMGCAQAQAWMSLFAYERSRVAFAEQAAAQNEPAGLAVVAECCWDGDGCDQDVVRALALWQRAAELGDVAAAFHVGDKKYGENCPERYLWWGIAANGGYYNAPLELVASASGQVRLYDENQSNGPVVFAIGHALKDQIHMGCRTVYGRRIHRDDFFENAKYAVDLYRQWISSCKLAVRCWIWTARQRGVVRDIRILIAKLLWADQAAWSASPPSGALQSNPKHPRN